MMTIFDKFTEGEFILPPKNGNGLSLRTKLLFTLIPSVILILLITGYITYLTSSKFLTQALERSARLQARAMAHEIEAALARTGQDLLFIAQNYSNSAKLRQNFADFIRLEGIDFREIGFISQKDKNHTYFVAGEKQIVELESSMIPEVNPDPGLYLEPLARLKPGEIWISDIVEVEYPFPISSNPNQKIRSHVIYFGTPCTSQSGERSGFLLMSVDTRVLRNILSLYDSPQSPLWAFARTPEVRLAYFYDLDGWILFQSEDPGEKNLDFTTDLARMDYADGTLGKPGHPAAFRPGSQFQAFWKMISDTKEGKFNAIELAGKSQTGSEVKNYFLAYSPVSFQGRIIAGVAYIDRTRFTLAAGYRHLDIMLILSIITILAVSLIIFVFSRVVTQPIYKLTDAVDSIHRNRKLAPIDIRTSVYEVNLLQHAINNMMKILNSQIAEIRRKDLKIQDVESKERIDIQPGLNSSPPSAAIDTLPEIIGYGPRIDRFKSDILKAAGVDADVLIMGETGTGKQLAAEAIHAHSGRGEGPFISINCGELAENLLLDSLFGHVKGAFTEAKADRKGAFLMADHGTLFLDEIQTASLTVQQALLRAVAMRKVKPLGTDKEYGVDVRLICATNVDLRQLIDSRQFRSDLYFRLKVITVFTPPLRAHRENIPVLINHYLTQLQHSTGREDLGISKGALEKMKQYDWPGNIRELMNCITRAVVMAESHIIQAGDVLLEGESAGYSKSQFIGEEIQAAGENAAFQSTEDDCASPYPESSPEVPASAPADIPMNSRQQKAYAHILDKKTITRNEYQARVGENISARTAIYDLQDLVKKGVLRKEGSGPATRYTLIEGE